MPLIFEHFWLITGAYWTLFACVYMRFKLRKHVASGEFTAAEVKTFTTKLALWTLLPSCAFWALQKSSGAEVTPIALAWPTPQKVAAIALQLLISAALLYWVFRCNGASTLSKFAAAMRSPKPAMLNPAAIKVLTIIVAVSSVASPFVWHFVSAR